MLTSVIVLPGTDGGPPASALEIGGETLLVRLARQLSSFGRVVVLAEVSCTSAGLELPEGVDIHEVASAREAAGWFRQADGDLLVIQAGVVAPGLAIERLAEPAAAGTWALLGEDDRARASRVRSARGRITAASSTYHRVTYADHAFLGVLRVGQRDHAAFREVASELGELLPEPIDAGLVDVVDLLLVGLVRRGIDVRVRSIPAGLPWRRPTDHEAAAAAALELERTDEERVRLDASVKDEDGFFTTFFVSTYSRYWARWCARRGISPDQVTLASMALGGAAAGSFAIGQRWAAVVGAIVLQLAFTLDCVDGQLARYTRRFTASGAWLDSMFDRGKEYVVYAGLAVGAVRAGDEMSIWMLAAGTLALQVFRHQLDFGYATQQTADLADAGRGDLTDPGEVGAVHWEPVPAIAGEPIARRGPAGAARRIVELLRVAEGVAALKWLKRIVVLPIGERFAVISLVTAIATPRLTFTILLAWGAIATAYTFGGRVVRSVT